MRHFEIRDINEMGPACMFVDNKPHYRHGYERGLAEKVNPILLKNAFKVLDWIKENCPNLTGEFPLRHDVYRMRRIVVENGEAVYEVGSWGGGFSNALGRTFSEVYPEGSFRLSPYRFENAYAILNADLEYLLNNWGAVKCAIVAKNKVQSYSFSEDFKA